MMWGYGMNIGRIWLWGLLLDDRFARGELSVEQYREQLTVLGEDQ